jgi:RsfA family transcription factor
LEKQLKFKRIVPLNSEKLLIILLGRGVGKVSRKEPWSEKEDKILSSIVRQFISENKTKKAAFLKVAENLSRTEAACAYRWNKVVKGKHFQKSEQSKDVLQEDSFEINLEKCIIFLQELKNPTADAEIGQLQKERDNLLLKQKRLKSKLKNLMKKEIKMKQMLAIIKEAEELNVDNNKTAKSIP